MRKELARDEASSVNEELRKCQEEMAEAETIEGPGIFTYWFDWWMELQLIKEEESRCHG